MFGRRPPIAGAEISSTRDETGIDPGTGAVTSRQSAEIVLPTAEAERLWSAEMLERLARTYWVTLTRVTLGLVRVHYGPEERSVVFLRQPLRMLTFLAPEYEVGASGGRVRWRIARGLLVAQAGREGDGYLELAVSREDEPGGERTKLLVTVDVANYYPALGGISRWLYVHTQSRFHVIACNYFLRRLVRRELAPARPGAARPGSPGAGTT